MKFYSSDIVEKIREERRKGFTLRQLGEKFNIPNNTISIWVRDIKSHTNSFLVARKREESSRNELKRVGDNFKIDKTTAQILVSILYWCEGSKYPATNNLSFSNSDYYLVKLYIELLRIGFNINERKFRARLQIHTTHNYKKELTFWSKLLKISKKQFERPTVTNPTKNMKRLSYRGTCTIKYYDVKLQLNIMGIYEALGKRVISGGLPER
ncbi:MAG: hypothetical protein UT63_C0012G0014 [Candidatus Gottesmanbacteria bacterium GW2011_GWC2_39_8]|uniref:Uncharacterized protein n=1 Tax=Candidatus Gottesmanbacteria bacterium GW2011_GWC2_39_8 TaxID=1618450 RepID=A0A0G0SG98_9BACT|nr:MAG: hypothetical protein UT63_C0012G0014 [Candidatus Gottesmanbacteria bacterium GW2011_GWC2_39_8]